MENEYYLIIECGCEGIEQLVYPTNNGIDAKNKLKSIREDIAKAKEHMKKVLKEFGEEKDDCFEDAWDKLYYDKKITAEEHDMGCFKNPDAYCIQKWDGKNFICVCGELDCEPSKPWFM